MRSWRATALLAGAGLLLAVAAGCSSPSTTRTTSTGTGPPAVTAIVPTTGTTPGGTTVTVIGVGFNGATKVAFGTVAATSYKVVNSTRLTVVSPPHAAGAATVVVTTHRGSSTQAAVGRFTYTIPVPVVAAVTPSSGTVAGGTLVSVTGSWFDGATKVTFGKVAAATYRVLSNTQILAVTPPQTGARGVVVTTPSGTSAKVHAVRFAFKLIPVVTGISPTSGTTEGGTTITITGTGFTRVNQVAFNRVPATSFHVVSDTQITAVTPAQGAGTRYVAVVTAGGRSAQVPNALFTFQPPVPVVTGITPATGPVTGGTPVTINGSGFTRATKVTFGGLPATSVVVVSDSEITAITPAQGAGARFVNVTAPGGRSASTPTVDQFTYQPTSPPT
jgi:hypothetical protein